MDSVGLERAVVERALVVADPLQVPLGELVGVDDQVRATGQVGEVGLQRSGVHGDQHVGRVARGHDVVVGEVQLEGRDAQAASRREPGSRRGSQAGWPGRCRARAVSLVNRSPVSCMPSPESPANRMITRSSCTTCLATVRCYVPGACPLRWDAQALAWAEPAAPSYDGRIRSGLSLGRVDGGLSGRVRGRCRLAVASACSSWWPGLLANRLLRPVGRRPPRSPPPTSAGSTRSATGWAQTHIRYYVFAYLYVIFAVDAVYLFPWATVFDAPGYGVVTLGRDGRLHRVPRHRDPLRLATWRPEVGVTMTAVDLPPPRVGPLSLAWRPSRSGWCSTGAGATASGSSTSAWPAARSSSSPRR